ncbi:hypothetical protein [Pseudomonas entomophila]|uniref:hypothetical protein n=1 Tax=Pseudomonas entomophila TaxID=312306 RepID=UPI001F003B5C|nr:hypothetical protein [Pseudomonas entomophila]MCG8294164.1 hypothetical protein [Pseudomonas entomophila]
MIAFGDGCAWWLRFYVPVKCARVLPGSTFGAFVSGYFSNPDLAWGFGGLSVKAWQNALQAAPLLAAE